MRVTREVDLLEKIGDNVDGMIEGQAKIRTKLAEHEELLTELEARANRRRFGGGGDDPAERRERILRGAAHWFLAVAGRDRADNFKRAEDLFGIAVEKRALQEDVNTEGGFLVPTALAAEILIVAATVAAVRPISRTIPMRSHTLAVPDVSTKPSVSVIAEEAVIPTSDPVLGQKTITAKKICARVIASLELEQDSAVSVADMLIRLFAEAITQKEDAEALEGDGTNFSGIFSASGVNAVAAGGSLTNFDKLIDALYALPVPAIAAATWIMHPKVLKALAKLKTTTNEYLFNPTPSEGTPATLLGRPIRLSDQISTSRGAGADTTIYCGDFGNGMLFGDRMMLEFASNPFVNWSTAQVDFRVLERVGIVVGLPSHFSKLTGATV